MKIAKDPSFAHMLCDTRKRKVKNTFFKQIDKLVNWRMVTIIINKHYTKGESASGKPSYSGLLLFKMGLLQTRYELNDYEVEERINDSISYGIICGLSIEDFAPDWASPIIARLADSEQ